MRALRMMDGIELISGKLDTNMENAFDGRAQILETVAMYSGKSGLLNQALLSP